MELAPFGVNVNAVSPGPIKTAATDLLPPDVLARSVNAVPMGRIGLPEEIAGAIAYLASDEAAYVTGQNLAVNGGLALTEAAGMDKLQGKVAIVTGGAGGIGRAYALRLALLGADVAIVDVDLDVASKYGEKLSAESVMEEVKRLGGRSIGIQADLSQQDAARSAVSTVFEQMGQIDILVNNAGGAVTPIDRSRASESPLEDTEKLFAANFYSMVHCCQAAVPLMRRRGGAIVNVATNGVDRTPSSGRLAMYNSAKAAVIRYTQHSRSSSDRMASGSTASRLESSKARASRRKPRPAIWERKPMPI